jgi:hypothetical protein
MRTSENGQNCSFIRLSLAALQPTRSKNSRCGPDSNYSRPIPQTKDGYGRRIELAHIFLAHSESQGVAKFL